MANQVVFPVYIDVDAVFDIVATLENGLVIVEQINEQSDSRRSRINEGQIGGGVDAGLTPWLKFFKLEGNLLSKGERTSGKTEQRSAEKYHTLGSLLSKLRLTLEDSIIRLDSDASWHSINTGDFIELKGKVQPSPLDAFTQSLKRAMQLANVAALTHTQVPIKPKAKSVYNNPSTSQQSRALQTVFEEVNKILEGIEKDSQDGVSKLFVMKSADPFNTSVLLRLYVDYVRDKTFAQMNNKDYHVLGKVVRKTEESVVGNCTSENGCFDLFEGTGMGAFGKDGVDSFLEALNSLTDVNLPRIDRYIAGPALEVLPIGIYI